MNSRTSAFWRTHYSHVSSRLWNSWHWQLANQILTADQLSHFLQLSTAESQTLASGGRLPFAITPYYASLLDADNPAQPLRRTVIPLPAENQHFAWEEKDSLGEECHQPLPGLIHTYPDKVLILVTGRCATYCRYCTRSRRAGMADRQQLSRWQGYVDYISERPQIRDVLLSGGDPLLLADGRLAKLLSVLRRIPHVEIIRLGTKVPAVLPQRITPALVTILKQFQPLWISAHFIHPDELTEETALACGRLVDAGLPIISQTVLLAGVNDQSQVLKSLFNGLLRLRVKPYYLHQCDQVVGTAHFRVPVEQGLAIMESLNGHTSGFAVPLYMIDAPGGGGKVPVMPSYILKRDGNVFHLRNYKGEHYQYRQ